MDLERGIQEHLIALIAYDDRSCGIAVDLVPEHLYSKYYREFHACCAGYLRTYKKPIGEHLFDEVNRLRSLHPKDESIYYQIFQSVYEIRSCSNAEYVLRRAGDFIAYQTTKAALAESISLLEKGTPESITHIHSIWSSAMRVSLEKTDSGTFLHDKERFLSFLHRPPGVSIPSGVAELDAIGACPTKKRLHLLAALYGKGKTFWLLNMIKQCILVREPAVYFSLEMPEDECCERIVGTVFGYSRTKRSHRFYRIDKDVDGAFLDLRPLKIDAPSWLDEEGVEALYQLVDLFHKRPPVIIKSFPNGRLTMDHMSHFLDVLSSTLAFIPGLVAVDYLELCKIKNVADKTAELGQLAVDYRALAMERNFAACTVAQLNRTATGEDLATGHNVGSAFSLAAHADYFLTYNQTDVEKRLQVARLWNDKARNTEGGFAVLITQDYGRGQFCIDSARMSDAYGDVIKGFGD